MELFKTIPELFIAFLEENSNAMADNINALQNTFQWFGSAIWGIQKGGGFNLKGWFFIGRLGEAF